MEGVKEKSNKCYQCKYTFSRGSDIKKHEKRIKDTNKCNLCEYASSNAGFIRRHMKKKKMLPVQLYIVVYQETLKHSQDQRDK